MPLQTLVLWDYDPYSPNDEIGRCEVKLSELEAGRSLDLWLDVVSHSEPEPSQCRALAVQCSAAYHWGCRGLLRTGNCRGDSRQCSWLGGGSARRQHAQHEPACLPHISQPLAGEEEQERTKHDLSAGDRAIRGVAKPFVHHSTKGCQLHVQVGCCARGAPLRTGLASPAAAAG